MGGVHGRLQPLHVLRALHLSLPEGLHPRRQRLALVTYDRRELILDLLSYKGLSDEAKVRIVEAEKEKAAKEAAKAAKSAPAGKSGPAAKSAPAAKSVQAEGGASH